MVTIACLGLIALGITASFTAMVVATVVVGAFLAGLAVAATWACSCAVLFALAGAVLHACWGPCTRSGRKQVSRGPPLTLGPTVPACCD